MPKKGQKTKKYSKELKSNAIQDYLNGKGNLREIAKKYGILSSEQVRRWVLCYNSRGKINWRSYEQGEIYMTKGRKTTQAERAEIVAYCLNNNKDYALTVQTYKISYNQIYAWVKKYEEGGVDKLQDNRGRTKPESELSEVERLKLEIKLLEAKNRQLEIENAFIKKLEELKGGGR